MQKIEKYFVDIIGEFKWFLKVALFVYPYFGRDFDDVDWTDVLGVGKGWCCWSDDGKGWCQCGSLGQ